MPVDLNFMVGGEAGQGVQSAGFILAKVFTRGGYNIFGDQDYESRVRGGHNFFRVRVKDSETGAIREDVNILLALNEETIELHRAELTTDGVVIFDSEELRGLSDNGNLFGVPLNRLAEEKAGNKLAANTVAVGAALSLVGYDLAILDKILLEQFGEGEISKANIRAAHAGYEYTRQNFKGDFNHHLQAISDEKRMLLNGNEAIALGAIAAGCKFMAAYPITPATSIMEYMAAKAGDLGLVVLHAEDEISVINMIIGASYAGIRAMTATSGAGLSLMSEGIGLAGVSETPIVVVNAQRPGPAVGLATRTEQCDLESTLHISHGEFPRAIFAPATVRDAFWQTIKAFNIADKYQIPVFILTDQHLASSYTTIDKFNAATVNIDRGSLFSKEEAIDSEYARYAITGSGISPLAFPGQEGVLVVADSHEHNEAGHPTENSALRTEMTQKRMRKVYNLKKEITPPIIYGPKKAETLVIGWGSTYGAMSEAIDMLRKEGKSISLLHLNELWPFPAEAVTDAMDNTGQSYVIENNATGQLARLIHSETGKKVNGKILKYDGRPFTPEYIADEIRKEGC